MEKDNENMTQMGTKEKSFAKIVKIAWALVLIGIILVITGAVWVTIIPDSNDNSGTVCGVGIGLIIIGTLLLNGDRMRRKYPQRTRDLEILNADERNLQIMYKAKAKAFDIILVSTSFAMLLFLLGSIIYTDKLLLEVGVALCVILSMMSLILILFNRKYQKEM